MAIKLKYSSEVSSGIEITRAADCTHNFLHSHLILDLHDTGVSVYDITVDIMKAKFHNSSSLNKLKRDYSKVCFAS